MALPGLGYLPFIPHFHLQWNLDELQSTLWRSNLFPLSVIFPGVKALSIFRKISPRFV